MKRFLVAAALAVTMSGLNAAPYAPQEFDFSELALEGAAYGIIESVREVQLDGPYKGMFNAFEHAMKPAALDELLIRLDDGRAVILLQEEMQRFEPGQPVRLLSETSGMRFERHD